MVSIRSLEPVNKVSTIPAYSPEAYRGVNIPNKISEYLSQRQRSFDPSVNIDAIKQETEFYKNIIRSQSYTGFGRLSAVAVKGSIIDAFS